MKETFYFSHDYNARNDPKLVKVLMKLKQEGIGVYWCLIEMSYEEDGMLLLSECESYAFALHTHCDIIKSLINDFDLFVKNAEHFWSESVVNRLNKRYEKSEKATNAANKRWSDANALRTQSNSNASKVKKSKIKESKEQENKVNISSEEFEKFWLLYDKKVGNKQKIFGQWQKLNENEKKIIFATVSDYVASTPDKKFRKDPERYISNKTWESEIIKSNIQINGQSGKKWDIDKLNSAIKDVLTNNQ